MPNLISVIVALAISLGASDSFAACLGSASVHPECRYPKGDGWCATHANDRHYAYAGKCLEDSGKMNLEGRAPFNWFGFAELGGALRGHIDLGTFDNPDEVGFALIRLGENTPAGETDALLVYRFDRMWCGMAGCDLRIFSTHPDRRSKPLFSVSAGGGRGESGTLQTGLTLGESHRNGMRNLLIDRSVIWSWNGQEYTIEPATRGTFTGAVPAPAAAGYGSNYTFWGEKASTDMLPTAALTVENPPGVTFLVSCFFNAHEKYMISLEVAVNQNAEKTPAVLEPWKSPELDEEMACNLCFQGDCEDTKLEMNAMTGNFTKELSFGRVPEEARLDIALACDAISMTWTGNNMLPALCNIGD
ncbi:hypothetical protein Thiowin_04478 [Thiorhodovibrio winogradskyi]|uniref:Uncharacterized protein n=1 Tax=Thiorhodovibrio winogradskyi TaxID=77007 RepID=A0ABZ0SH47_9GAMM|nr:hypothetical protein [Thiorhodovibrio winogradskyi]